MRPPAGPTRHADGSITPRPFKSIMSLENQPLSPVFRIDVSSDSEPTPAATAPVSTDRMMVELMRQLVIGQQRTNQMLESLMTQQTASAGGPNDELNQWRDANPGLSAKCRRSAEILSKVQSEFLETITDEIVEGEDYLIQGDYMMNEFFDRFGPRMAHLNGILQMLAQLGSEPRDD